MLNLAGHVDNRGGYVNIAMEHGVVSFSVYDPGALLVRHGVTPADAKRILEDALEALTKWTLEH